MKGSEKQKKFAKSLVQKAVANLSDGEEIAKWLDTCHAGNVIDWAKKGVHTDGGGVLDFVSFARQALAAEAAADEMKKDTSALPPAGVVARYDAPNGAEWTLTLMQDAGTLTLVHSHNILQTHMLVADTATGAYVAAAARQFEQTGDSTPWHIKIMWESNYTRRATLPLRGRAEEEDPTAAWRRKMEILKCRLQGDSWESIRATMS